MKISVELAAARSATKPADRWLYSAYCWLRRRPWERIPEGARRQLTAVPSLPSGLRAIAPIVAYALAALLTTPYAGAQTIKIEAPRSLPLPDDMKSPRFISMLSKYASSGNKGAQEMLGNIYADGDGVPQDWTQATYWWLAAAKQGDAFSQNCVGFAYLFGYGLQRNYAASAYWLNESANRGFPPAENNLGVLYYYGFGVQRNIGEAKELFEKAAGDDDGTAASNLAALKSPSTH